MQHGNEFSQQIGGSFGGGNGEGGGSSGGSGGGSRDGGSSSVRDGVSSSQRRRKSFPLTLGLELEGGTRGLEELELGGWLYVRRRSLANSNAEHVPVRRAYVRHDYAFTLLSFAPSSLTT
ncbi:hypothetical protein HZH66_003623 [Vespula vulgaris]|uniref:Uncharacterized protein n=1 Tax=Vespula vulgaris TaxID=7454 RepID=A0A834ND05_VESVU|nr:hypothetical protein HZH66_003623 [Vespula vulgaris]